jgi:antibiotic biosynthesis monooxygenase (ABM) superfamily enzyme
MSKAITFVAQTLEADRSTGREYESAHGRSRLSMERRLARLATFLLTWLTAFLMVVGLFSVFGQQLKAMSPKLRALTLSGVLVVVMNFLVMPALTRLFSRFLPPDATSRKGGLT